MDRERVLTALAILLAVVVVGTVAAGLIDAPNAEGERDPGLGAGEGDGFGSGNGSGFGLESDVGTTGPIIPPWIVSAAVGALLTASVVFGGLYVVSLLVTRNLRALLRPVFDALLVFVVALGLLILAVFLSELLRNGGGGGTFGDAVDAVTGSGGAEPVSSLDFLAVAPAVVAVLAVLCVGFVVVAARRNDGSDDPDPPTADGGTVAPPRPGQGLDYGGDATDAPATNEVYRAWDGLAREVDAERTTTPAEVGHAAKAAGYDAEAVDELTALFREVRYGDGQPRSQCERRARELVVRLPIEAA